jgi:hypothetical protein
MLPKIIEGLIRVCIGGRPEVLLNPVRMGEVEKIWISSRRGFPEIEAPGEFSFAGPFGKEG